MSTISDIPTLQRPDFPGFTRETQQPRVWPSIVALCCCSAVVLWAGWMVATSACPRGADFVIFNNGTVLECR